MKKPHNTGLLYIGAALAGSLLTNPGWAADSIPWSIGTKHNNHSYQIFDLPQVSWLAAQSKCDSLGGYLATITSQEEQGFVAANLLTPGKANFKGHHIGGFKDTGNKWRWITNEPWRYTNWYSEKPQREGLHAGIYNINSGQWLRKDYTPDIDGYICEWNAIGKKVLSSVIIPDINNNGAFEFATLYQNTRTKVNFVEIKDLVTNMLLSSLTFSATTQPAIGIAVLKNIEAGNTTPEIGILIYADLKSIVQIKDVKNNQKIINSITFLGSDYKPESIGVLPDINGNLSNEIIVFGRHIESGKGKMEIRDSKTKAILNTVAF
jgi:Lectin C-type domain